MLTSLGGTEGATRAWKGDGSHFTAQRKRDGRPHGSPRPTAPTSPGKSRAAGTRGKRQQQGPPCSTCTPLPHTWGLPCPGEPSPAAYPWHSSRLRGPPRGQSPLSNLKEVERLPKGHTCRAPTQTEQLGPAGPVRGQHAYLLRPRPAGAALSSAWQSAAGGPCTAASARPAAASSPRAPSPLGRRRTSRTQPEGRPVCLRLSAKV